MHCCQWGLYSGSNISGQRENSGQHEGRLLQASLRPAELRCYLQQLAGPQLGRRKGRTGRYSPNLNGGGSFTFLVRSWTRRTWLSDAGALLGCTERLVEKSADVLDIPRETCRRLSRPRHLGCSQRTQQVQVGRLYIAVRRASPVLQNHQDVICLGYWNLYHVPHVRGRPIKQEYFFGVFKDPTLRCCQGQSKSDAICCWTLDLSSSTRCIS